MVDLLNLSWPCTYLLLVDAACNLICLNCGEFLHRVPHLEHKEHNVGVAWVVGSKNEKLRGWKS